MLYLGGPNRGAPPRGDGALPLPELPMRQGGVAEQGWGMLDPERSMGSQPLCWAGVLRAFTLLQPRECV